jgi:hypothetical protein
MEFQSMLNHESRTGGLIVRLVRSLAAFLRGMQPSKPQILVVVEGANDIEFLRRISTILHHADKNLPDSA